MKSKRRFWRVSALILIALIAALPALVGYLARRTISAELTARGIGLDRLIITPGWFSSRLVILAPEMASGRAPGTANLRADLQLAHGPYTGQQSPGGPWGWLAVQGTVADSRGILGRVEGELGTRGRYSFAAIWNELPALPPGAVVLTEPVKITLSGNLTKTPARLKLKAGALKVNSGRLDAALESLVVAADWPPVPLQPWHLLADFSGAAFEAGPRGRNPPDGTRPAPARIGAGSLTLDWLPGAQELIVNLKLQQLAGGGAELEALNFGGAIAPLDPEALGQTVAALPAGGGNPAFLFLPLMASRPVLTIDRLSAAAGDRRFMLEGSLAPRLGGLYAKTQGGGDGEILQALIQMYHFQSSLDDAAAALVLEQIRREGWLQRQDGEWRADIVINY